MKTILKSMLLALAVMCATNAHAAVVNDTHTLRLVFYRFGNDTNISNDMSKPMKVPHNLRCPITAFYDDVSNSMYFVGDNNAEVEYAVYDTDGTLLQTDTVTLANGNCVIYLSCPPLTDDCIVVAQIYGIVYIAYLEI